MFRRRRPTEDGTATAASGDGTDGPDMEGLYRGAPLLVTIDSQRVGTNWLDLLIFRFGGGDPNTYSHEVVVRALDGEELLRRYVRSAGAALHARSAILREVKDLDDRGAREFAASGRLQMLVDEYS